MSTSTNYIELTDGNRIGKKTEENRFVRCR